MSATIEHSETYLPAGEGETLWVLGTFVTLKTPWEGGGLSVYEVLCPPGSGPPPHIHHEQEEAFYVLEGGFSFLCGDTTVEAGTGSFVRVPRGILHTFKSIGAATGRFLGASTLPGAHERFFRDVGVPVSDIASFQPPDGPPDIDKVLRSGERNDSHFVLPAQARD
jgi:mannose-6-phosphate isomerase-like protein (cupin superfamily)